MKKNNPVNEVNSLLHTAYMNNHPAEAANRLEEMQADDIASILEAQPVKLAVTILEYLSPEIGTCVFESLQETTAVSVLNLIEPARGAAFLNGLQADRRNAYLELVDTRATVDLKQAMTYPPDTAGACMDTQLTFYKPDMTVQETTTRLRIQKHRGLRVIPVVNDNAGFLGMVEVQELALSAPDIKLESLMLLEPVSVEAMTTKEEIIEQLGYHRLTDIPVLDHNRCLLGIVPYHRLIEISIEETSTDIQMMFGVSKDENALSTTTFAIRKRLPWLQINLATAFLAAFVVGIFEDTIARFTALAVLLPVVAGQSGNTGAQALAVTMRGLSLREIRVRQWPKLILKEFNVGLWNGVAVALVTVVGVFVWSDSTVLCVIIAISMIISMIIASISGAAIPLILRTIGQDPAQSSSIFLTTITDVVGFFSFLGIATLLLGMM